MIEKLTGNYIISHGGIVRDDSIRKRIALLFTGDEFADGGFYINEIMKRDEIKASFFFTGRFYRNIAFRNIILALKHNGHFLGPHSDQHPLYCDWVNRDSLLITQAGFIKDLGDNIEAMRKFGIHRDEVRYFMPPYQWYNDSISKWTAEQNMLLVNFTPGTLSNADYTTPEMPNYRSSDIIMESILNEEQNNKSGLNGFLLLMHIGTERSRTDKLYYRLPDLVAYLKRKGYEFVRVDELLQ